MNMSEIMNNVKKVSNIIAGFKDFTHEGSAIALIIEDYCLRYDLDVVEYLKCLIEVREDVVEELGEFEGFGR